MKLLGIIRKALATQIITPEMDTQIRHLLWTTELTEVELEAMHQLMAEIAGGKIECAVPAHQLGYQAA